MKTAILVALISFMLIFLLPGCTESPAVEDTYLDEAPDIRITAEALEALSADGKAHMLTYITRAS